MRFVLCLSLHRDRLLRHLVRGYVVRHRRPDPTDMSSPPVRACLPAWKALPYIGPLPCRREIIVRFPTEEMTERIRGAPDKGHVGSVAVPTS